MSLKRITRSSRRRAVVSGALAAYAEWRQECNAVRAAYRGWVGSSTIEEPLAFAAYEAALEREGRAAQIYARSMKHAGRLPEIALARQLAQIK